MAEMNNDEKCAIRTALDNLLDGSRSLGTFPFNENNELAPSRLIVLFIIGIAYSYISLKFLVFQSNSVTIIVTCLALIVMILLPILHVAWLYNKRTRLSELYSKLSLVGKYFQSVNVEWNLKHKWVYKYLSLCLVSQLFAILVSLRTASWLTAFINLSYIYVSIYSLYDQVFSICAVITYSFSRLKYVTDNRQLLRNKEILMSLCKTVQELFSPQILFIIVITFVINISVLFRIFKNFRYFLDYPLVSSSALTLALYPLVRIVISMNVITIHARKIDKLLYRRLLENPYDKMLEFHMTAKRDVTFTAFGFFRINSSLISSMIGAGTTYLVILLQYGK